MLIAGGNASLYPSIGGIFALDTGSLSSRTHWDTGSAVFLLLLAGGSAPDNNTTGMTSMNISGMSIATGWAFGSAKKANRSILFLV